MKAFSLASNAKIIELEILREDGTAWYLSEKGVNELYYYFRNAILDHNFKVEKDLNDIFVLTFEEAEKWQKETIDSEIEDNGSFDFETFEMD